LDSLSKIFLEMDTIMKIKTSAMTLALIAATASFSAFAQDNSTALTRAQVQADLRAYQASGLQALATPDQGVNAQSAEYLAAVNAYVNNPNAYVNSKTVAGSAMGTPLTRAQVQADLLAYKQSGLQALMTPDQGVDSQSVEYVAAVAAYENNPNSISATHEVAPVTRAEVRADLKAWQESGMAALSYGDHNANTMSPAYKAAHARYEALRSAS
jgi:hypothetical protein